MLRALIATLLIISTSQAYAMSPSEYCGIHAESKAPGTCIEKGNCAVITTNLGTEECKKCTEGGCELTDCSECEE